MMRALALLAFLCLLEQFGGGQSHLSSDGDADTRFSPKSIRQNGRNAGTRDNGPVCDVTAYGAKGDFIHDGTSAINSAIAACAGSKGVVYFPPGTYRILPATAATGSDGPYLGAFPMQSDMHIQCAKGAILRLADGQSTDANPKNLAMFFTGSALSHITIRGCVLDMNGLNNPISPNRPTHYNRFNMSQIRVTGPSGRLDDVVIEDNQFVNSPGTNCIVAAVSNQEGIALGKRWIIAHNVFLNNGTDTDDHTSVYGWAEDMKVYDNIFGENSPFGTVGSTGGRTAFEVHGSNADYHDNIVYNYYRGAFIANNYSRPTTNVDVHDNVFQTEFVGIQIFRSNAQAAALSGVKIRNNVFSFDDTRTAGTSAKIKTAIALSPDLAVSNFDIENNYAQKLGTEVASRFLILVSPTTPSQVITDMRVYNNTVAGFSQGIEATTQYGINSFGYLEVAFNNFMNLAPGGILTNSFGVFVDATSAISELVLDGNLFIDERGGGAVFQNGIYLQRGRITNLYVGPQIYKGLTKHDYVETGGIVIANRLKSRN